MNVLVVDDDAPTRLILRRMLSHFPCRVTMAVNGVEALAAIEATAPDLVLLDVQMPMMDGVDTLAAIRASRQHADLPVVSISGVSDRALVVKLVNLGLTDYLLKPIDVARTRTRLAEVFATIQRDRPASKPRAQDDRKLRIMVVDPDPNFRGFARPLLEGRFEVTEAGSGGQAAQLFLESRPDAVCIGEGLPLLGERLLATTIRSAARTGIAPAAGIYLVSESGAAPAADRALYDGVIRKSFVPDVFLRSFQSTVAGAETTAQRMAGVIGEELRAELVTAARQTVGVLTLQEASVVEGTTQTPDAEVQAVVELCVTGDATCVAVGAFATRADVEGLAARVVGGAIGFDDGAADAFGEIVNTIAGRIRASLASRGFTLEQSAPKLGASSESEPQWNGVVTMKTEGGERIQLGLLVRDAVAPCDAQNKLAPLNVMPS